MLLILAPVVLTTYRLTRRIASRLVYVQRLLEALVRLVMGIEDVLEFLLLQMMSCSGGMVTCR